MEFELIDLIREHLPQAREDVVLGIGDDAALLRVPAGQVLAVTTDTLVEGGHFVAGTDPADIGWKSLAVNLSDLAAMGAEPAWAVVALTLPREDRAFVTGFVAGLGALATRHHVALVGGDTTQGPLSITITVHGFVPAALALRRDAARPGDVLFVTGTLGDAAAALEHGGFDLAAPEPLRGRLLRPEPRVAAGLALRGIATTAIDVSDGLLADLGHICQRSGVGAELDVATMPRSPALRQLCGAAALDYALAGGDDYELCFAVPAPRAERVLPALAAVDVQATRIGRVVAGAGIRLLDAAGRGRPLPARQSWEHFRT